MRTGCGGEGRLVRDWRGVGGGRAAVLDLLLRGAEGREGALE